MDESKISEAKEFLFLFQPLSLEDRGELEERLVAEDICQTIAVWGNTLMEPPERFQICRDWGIGIKYQEMDFLDTLDAGVYICRKELSRKDLTIEMRTYLIGRLFLYRQEIAARDFVNRNPNTIICRRQGNRPKGMYETAGEISRELNLATGTILKYGRYASAIESIKRLEPSVAKAILSHRIRISHEDLQELNSNEERISIYGRRKTKTCRYAGEKNHPGSESFYT